MAQNESGKVRVNDLVDSFVGDAKEAGDNIVNALSPTQIRRAGSGFGMMITGLGTVLGARATTSATLANKVAKAADAVADFVADQQAQRRPLVDPTPLKRPAKKTTAKRATAKDKGPKG